VFAIPFNLNHPTFTFSKRELGNFGVIIQKPAHSTVRHNYRIAENSGAVPEINRDVCINTCLLKG